MAWRWSPQTSRGLIIADLETLEDWAGLLLHRLEPAGHTQLARTLAQQLHRSQQQRILAQRNPDGTQYSPRKPRNLRGKKDRVKHKAKNLQKLRTARFLKSSGDGSLETVGFAGRTARIARVHQEGLKDRAPPRSKCSIYAARNHLLD